MTDLTEDDIEWIKNGYMYGLEYVRQGADQYRKQWDDFEKQILEWQEFWNIWHNTNLGSLKEIKDKAEKWDRLHTETRQAPHKERPTLREEELEAQVKSLQEEKETYRKSMHQRADEWLAENIEKEKYKEIVSKIRDEGFMQTMINRCQDTDGYVSVSHIQKEILGDES